MDKSTMQKSLEDIRAIGLLTLYLTITYTLCRICYLIANHELLVGWMEEWTRIVLTGFRFDLATVFLTNAPIFGLLILGIHRLGKSSRRTIFGIGAAVNVFGVLLNLADVVYFPHSFRRMTSELLMIPKEVLTAAISELPSHWLLALVILLVTSALMIVINRTIPYSRSGLKWHRSDAIVRLVGLMALTVLGLLAIRGGIQARPLRPAMGLFSDNLPLGQAGLNSYYTFLWSSWHESPRPIRQMPDSLAVRITRQTLQTENVRYLNSSYPLYRSVTSPRSDTTHNYNVIILIFESWNAAQTGAIAGGASITPVFDSLAKHGTLYTRTLACGVRSIHAFPGILSSLPNLAGDRLMHSESETNSFIGLGSILKLRGYQTLFAMGVEKSAMGFDSYSHAAGFDSHLSIEDFTSKSDRFVSPHWGIYDEFFLEFLDSSLAEINEPFCGVFFSLTGHSPFETLEEFNERYPLKDEPGYPESSENPAVVDAQSRAMRYADYSLGKFIERFTTHKYSERTILVITADHVGWTQLARPRNDIQRFHIPLLIIGPGVPHGAVDSLPASQTDIAPTVLSILGGEYQNAFAGASLLDGRTHRMAVASDGISTGVYLDSSYLMITGDSVRVAYRARGRLQLIEIDRSQAEYGTLSNQALGFYQTVRNAIVTDRVAPANWRWTPQ